MHQLRNTTRRVIHSPDLSTPRHLSALQTVLCFLFPQSQREDTSCPPGPPWLFCWGWSPRGTYPCEGGTLTTCDDAPTDVVIGSTGWATVVETAALDVAIAASPTLPPRVDTAAGPAFGDRVFSTSASGPEVICLLSVLNAKPMQNTSVPRSPPAYLILGHKFLITLMNSAGSNGGCAGAATALS